MNTADHDRQAWIDLTTVIKMLNLTPGQRIKLAPLVAADRTLGGLRADGTMALDTALKFCKAAKER